MISNNETTINNDNGLTQQDVEKSTVTLSLNKEDSQNKIESSENTLDKTLHSSLPTEEDDNWQKQKSNKKKKPLVKSVSLNDDVNNNDTTKQKSKSMDKNLQHDEFHEKQRITPEDLVISWINSEHEKSLWGAKKNLFERLMNSLKNSQYQDVNSAADFVRYLSHSAQQFFQKVVEHVDKKNSTITTLYNWNCQSYGHYYIVATSIYPSNWVNDRLDVYKSIFDKNVEDVDGKSVLSKKGYSILRRHAIKDLCMEFMKLRFFTNYNFAKAFVINSVDGFVYFNKKTTESNTDEEDCVEVSN